MVRRDFLEELMINKLSWTQRVLGLALIVALGSVAAHVAAVRNTSADSQYLPESHLVLKSARDVNAAASTVVIPIHRGVAHGETVWYIITDASDYGIAHDLNVLFAPKLANMAINCPECVQTATLGKPTGNSTTRQFCTSKTPPISAQLACMSLRLPASHR